MRTFTASLICGLLAASFATLLFVLGAFAPLELLLGPGRATALWPQWLGAFVLAFGLAWTTLDIRQLALQAVVAAIAFVETVAMAAALKASGITWSPFTALIAGALAIGFALICSHSSLNRRKRLIASMLEGRISKRTFRSLLKSEKPLHFSGERLTASVIICQLHHRQLLAGSLSPADYPELCNAFQRTAAEALKSAGAILAGPNSEGVQAIFGLPMEEAGHASRACEAAWRLRQQLELFCRECSRRWKLVPEYGIGVNSGELIAGIHGSGRFASFGVEGESLEFCRGLSAAEAEGRSRILIGPGTFALASEAAEVFRAELLPSRGKKAVEVYEMLRLTDHPK